MRLTLKRLQEALSMACIASNLSKRDYEKMAASIKMGVDAREHLGQKPNEKNGAKAYFATEETNLTAYYYDAQKLYWAWEEKLREELQRFGVYAEPKNVCEFAIYE